MALVFAFDTIDSIANPRYPKDPKTVAKVEKALATKKVPPAQTAAFVKQLKDYNFSPMTALANQYITKNMVAKGLAPVTNDPNAVQKAFIVAIYGPQKKVLQAKFDLSVHLKGTDLQLQHTDCKGASTVFFTVAR